MEEILKAIVQAESDAAERKEAAQREAEQIVAAAEARALEIERQSEADAKALRERILSDARRTADEDYSARVSLQRNEAKKYADGILENADPIVKKIAEEITSGR